MYLYYYCEVYNKRSVKVITVHHAYNMIPSMMKNQQNTSNISVINMAVYTHNFYSNNNNVTENTVAYFTSQCNIFKAKIPSSSSYNIAYFHPDIFIRNN